MIIRPVGTEWFHGMDGQTDMKLIVAFRNFANAPKTGLSKGDLRGSTRYRFSEHTVRITETR